MIMKIEIDVDLNALTRHGDKQIKYISVVTSSNLLSQRRVLK